MRDPRRTVVEELEIIVDARAAELVQAELDADWLTTLDVNDIYAGTGDER